MNLVEIQKEIFILKEKINAIKKKEINKENALELVALDKDLDHLIKQYIFINKE